MQKEIALKDIRIDGGTQQRPIDETVVARYKALMMEGIEFPLIQVVWDGHDFWLADGFHRFHAMRKLGKNMIQADVNDGTQRDAIFFSFSANSDHGFARQPGTIKTMLMEKIFPDDEWSQMTDEATAACIGGVSRSHITKCRASFNRTGKPANKTPEKCDSPQSEESVTPEKTEQPVEELKSEVDLSEVKDSLGQAVPEHLAPIFARIPEIRDYMKTITDIFRGIREKQANGDKLYNYCKIESLQADIGNIRQNLRFTLPYCVCKYCGGDVNNADCRACNGTGIQNEQSYIATPEEMK